MQRLRSAQKRRGLPVLVCTSGLPQCRIIAALAEFERDIISERTIAGLEAARDRGRNGGRRKAIETLRPDQVERAKELYAERSNTIAEIMALTGFKSRNTFYKYVLNGER